VDRVELGSVFFVTLAFVARSGAGVGACGSGCGCCCLVWLVALERARNGDHFEPNLVLIA
jgi:hypothetical protein